MKSTVLIEVTGKNVSNFINRLVKQNKNIYKLNIETRNKCLVKIDYSYYLELLESRSIYEYKLIKKYGKLNIKDRININKYLYIFIMLGISLLYFLSNIIFDIEIIHNKKEIRELIKNELDYYDIKTLTMKRNYQDLEKIEDLILEKNKTTLEWIEIEEKGTKYIVRVEERIINSHEENNTIQNVVASKSSILKKIEASSGVIMKNKNDYVTQGEVIISGEIIMPRGETVYTKAEGKAYGEVWYTVDVDYPYVYQEETLTGKSKEVITINFFHKRISLFDFKKFNTFKYNYKVIGESPDKTISIRKEKQYEMKVIDEIYTKEEVINKALEKANNMISKNLKDGEEITYYKPLEIIDKGETVFVKVFFKVIEEIGEIKIITPEIVNPEEE